MNCGIGGKNSVAKAKEPDAIPQDGSARTRPDANAQ